MSLLGRFPSYSLFDPSVCARFGPDHEAGLRRYLDRPSKLIPSDVEIFHALISTDTAEIHPTGIAGPISLEIDRKAFDCAKRRRKLKGWVESDRVRFKKVDAKGILYIEIGSLFDQFVAIKAWEKLGLILVCGYGIPRPMTRRLLHRMSIELKLPVFVLTDNDTWGYFIYSVLKRGSVAPDKMVPELAVKDVRFLGHRAGELKRTNNPKRLLIRWQSHWDLRLKAMGKYPCFRSTAWKNEFKEFRKQNGKYECAGLAYGMLKLAPKKVNVWKHYVDHYLLPKLQKREWLT